MFFRKINGLCASAIFLSTMTASVNGADVIGDITVTGTREETLRAETAETAGHINKQSIKDTKPGHPSEIMERVPGVHVNVTNGEGHMTAIRQPITTSPVYLYLEDGVPTRSTGFFNHNALYEVNIPQAEGVEITKGPGTSLYGSDAIGGVINVLTRAAPLEAEAEVLLEAGEHGWKRLLLSGGNTWGDDGVRGDLNVTHTDGWRDGTEYDRQSATVRWDSFLNNGGSLKTVLATSNIEQQTAGTSRLSEIDFLNNPTINYHPISFRDVDAVRLSTAYEHEDSKTLLSITPFVRHNVMEYMPNWSFGFDPSIKKTESNSFGLLAKYRMDFVPNRTRVIFGADIDHTPGERLEHSIDAVRTGSIFTSFTRQQVIYDYDVTFTGISPYVHVETSPWDNWRIIAGLRYDYMEYDYDNKMADGLLTLFPVSMGGRPANYNHPSDTSVDFSRFSPKLGTTYQFNSNLNGFASYRQAFRAPSEGQLFRPGSNAESLNLDAVRADSIEVGVRGETNNRIKYELSVYSMRVKDDLVSFIDPITDDRITVNAGETSHEGIELGIDSAITNKLELALSFSYAEHEYKEWVQRVNNANVDFSGNDILSAPKTIGNVRLKYTPGFLNGGRAEVELVHLGDYWMDQANTTKYEGHEIYNLRMNYFVNKKFEVFARLMNVSDKLYATAASLNRGNREFAPGSPRTFFAGAEYKF